MDVDPLVISADSSLGADYLACMHLAGRYAYAGRDWVCAEAARILGANIVEEVHNHHNFAWRENHGGQDLWVVRKGATPAFPGQRGFIGGSMGDISVIVEGVENDQAQWSLYSTVHGAGRVMGRHGGQGQIRPPDRQMHPARQGHAADDEFVRVTAYGTELRGGGRGRIAALLQAARKRPRRARRHHQDSPHPAAPRRRHGRHRGSVPGLRPAPHMRGIAAQ